MEIQNKSGVGKILDDLPLLLDQIEKPCLLINSESHTVLSANIQFTQLTHFGAVDIVGSNVSNLIPELNATELIEGIKIPARIINKSGNNIKILYEIVHLDNKKNISLLKLFTETGLMIDEGEEIFPGLSSMFEKIGWSVYAQNQSAFIETVITELSSLFKADVGLFFKNSDSGGLRRINESEHFPIVLPEVELDRYTRIDVWNIGKRVITEVHRIARKNNFTAVASIPIGRPTKGILILALPERNFEPQEIAALTEIQRWISFFERFDQKLSELTARNSQLSESENLYNIITDNCSDLILFIDSTGKIVGANSRFVEEIGFTMYELLRRPIADFLKVEDRTMGDPLLSTINSGACQLINHEGNAISVELQIFDIQDKNGWKVLIFSDNSAVDKLTNELKKAEKKASLGEVVADFAHEVRNPINNISTGLQVLRRTEGMSDDSMHAIDRMQSDCIRMNDLMESILSYSRQTSSEFKRIDLTLLLRRILSRFDRKIKRNGISASLICEIGNSFIHGDSRALDQVFTNILNNSIDSMQKTGGEIAITIDDMEENENNLVITIADSGTGIPEELTEKIFHPFTTGKEKGTGLGLAITKKIIDAHHGKISVESFTSGTIFSIEFMKAEQNQ